MIQINYKLANIHNLFKKHKFIFILFILDNFNSNESLNQNYIIFLAFHNFQN